MGVPSPPLDVTGHCSTLFNNTLYLFSLAGFQSISLSQGAQWKVLNPGVSVEGGACVNDNTSLWVVGGRSNSTTQSNFSGLQRYDFTAQAWSIVTPQVPVSQNRAGHGATFLNQSSEIIVYAGSQDPSNSNPSSQTFVISTSAPYPVLSYVSTAPPLTNPILMPWNASHAVMMGGDNDNKSIFLFGPQGWTNLGTSLMNPIATDGSQQSAIVTSDDGSKVLDIFNMAISPNVISEYLLFSNGQPVVPITAVGTPTSASSTSSRRFIRRKRDLTMANWPSYNASNAPTETRSGFQVAIAPDGLAVVSGGGASSSPLEFFQIQSNAWVDPNTIFGASDASTPSSPTFIPDNNSTSSTPSSSAVPANSNHHSIKVLGGALGGILGFAALLILVLLFIKYNADRRRRRAEERAANEKDDLSFADKGTLSYIGEHTRGSGFGSQTNVNTNSMVGSLSSFQIFGGKSASGAAAAGQQGSLGHKRGQNSDSSTVGLVSRQAALGSPQLMADILELANRGGAGQQQSDANNLRSAGMVAGSRPSTAPSASNVSDGTTYSPDKAVGAAARRFGPLDRNTAGWSQYFNDNMRVTNLATAPSSSAAAATVAIDKAPPQRPLSPSYLHPRTITPTIPSSYLHTSTLPPTTITTTGPSARSSVSVSEYDDESRHASAMSATMRGAHSQNLQPQRKGHKRRGLSGGSSFDHHRGGPVTNHHWSLLSEDRDSLSSISGSTGGAAGPAGNAFAVPNNPLTSSARPASPAMTMVGQAPGAKPTPKMMMGTATMPQTTTIFPFPIPKAYFPGGAGETEIDRYLELEQEREREMERERRGPKIKKLAGNEDLSWLNINVPGRAI